MSHDSPTVSDSSKLNNLKMMYRSDYKPPAYCIESIDLVVTLGDLSTSVCQNSHFKKQDVKEKGLYLNGLDQQLNYIKINDQLLDESDYSIDKQGLLIHEVPIEFSLEIDSTIKPQDNLSLMGLYRSNGIFCTQCESQGFRKITYYLDRPDVLATFTTTIIADQTKYPVLLSNGNLVDSQTLANGQHLAKWHDPFKKPCYLFALVAGDLGYIEDHFITISGRRVVLRIFADHNQLHLCHYAMQSLKKAMHWDEEFYGREYDLDIFMIVAVFDFNFGAMENKGLNIFNAQYIFVDPKTATDRDYSRIDTVVSHEYFHNWSGNRVTVRDWFQITLKEGLTVFRDHSFSETIESEVARINQVNTLYSLQFPEDNSSLAHPIRPDAYIEVSNFYTATVYEKGSEVIRMLKTLIGDQAYRAGTDLYFNRHDGCAVTCEDFVNALADASQTDLSQFRLWYEQSGTPTLKIESCYDQQNQSYQLTIYQSCPPTPGQPTKQPFLIPLRLALLNEKGELMPLNLANTSVDMTLKDNVLHLTKEKHSVTFTGIGCRPVPSLLRGLSAPVIVDYDYGDDELAFLIEHDQDPVARWQAGQQYALRQVKQLIHAIQTNQHCQVDDGFISVFANLLARCDDSSPGDREKRLAKELVALMLTLPSDGYVLESMTERVDIEVLCQATRFLAQTLAMSLENHWYQYYQQNISHQPYQYDVVSVGQRRLKNICLYYLGLLGEEDYLLLGKQQFDSADNMTDQLSALRMLTLKQNSYRTTVLENFYKQWQNQPLVIDKWFAIQAMADIPDLLSDIGNLEQHPDFSIKNPNRLRSLVTSFSHNLKHFHQNPKDSYGFLADYVLRVDRINPMVAARLLRPLTMGDRYDLQRQALMQDELKRILSEGENQPLSKDVYEIATKGLAKKQSQ